MLPQLWRTVSVSYWLAGLIVCLAMCNCKRQAHEIQHVWLERAFCFLRSPLPSWRHNNTRGSEEKWRHNIHLNTIQWLLPRGAVMDSVLMCQCRRREREREREAGVNIYYFSPPLALYWMVNNAADPPHPSAYWLMLCHSVSAETQPQCLHPFRFSMEKAG